MASNQPVTEEEREQAAKYVRLEMSLIEWGDVYAQRDRMVLSAYYGGVNKHRIYVLTGMARTTIDRIIEKDERPSVSPRKAIADANGVSFDCIHYTDSPERCPIGCHDSGAIRKAVV